MSISNSSPKIEETRKYYYRESEQAFSENGYFDNRVEGNGEHGFSVYRYGAWKEMGEVQSREEAMAWIKSRTDLLNPIRRECGSFQVMETVHSRVESEKGDSWMRDADVVFEQSVTVSTRKEIFYSEFRTKEQYLTHLQWAADVRDLYKLVFEKRADKENSFVVEQKQSMNAISSPYSDTPATEKKSLFRRIFY